MLLIKRKKNLNLTLGPRPGGDSHMKGAGMLVGNFELNPLKETNLGVAQLQPFFDP